MSGLHAYTTRLREEIGRNRQSVRGRNGVAEQAHLSAPRVEEIVAGDRPTLEEHRALCRGLPRMKFYITILEAWQREAPPVPPPPPEPKAAANGSNGVAHREPAPPPLPPLPPTPPAPLVLHPRSFGEYVRAAREREGLSPDDLAELVGVSRSAIYSWESEVSVPVAENYEALLGVLPVLAAPDVPRPDVRDIPKPAGRPPPDGTPAGAPPITSRLPLVAFGMALARADAALKSGRSAVVALLRDGAAAGLSCEEIATAIEGGAP